MHVDLLYLACNRLEFTRETFSTLLETTDWDLVNEILIYDDGSVDGTREWLESVMPRVPAPVRFVKTNFGSPVSAMVHCLRSSSAPVLVKTDNDAMLPPGWLRTSLDVMHRHPELSLLGIEAMYPHDPHMDKPRSYTSATFISGLGLYRRDAFIRSVPEPYDKWFGFEEWQCVREPDLIRGWITPAIPVFLLDRYPFRPWTEYSRSYIQRGFMRSWPKYDPNCTLWEWKWPAPQDRTESHPDEDIICVMRIKNESSHIREVLDRALEVCGCALVLDDHSTDATPAICRSFGERLTLIESPFEGLDEARDKNYLLTRVIERNPDWVLWIDGDEVLERTGPEKIRQAIRSAGSTAAFSLKVAYLWNDDKHIRVDGVFGNLRRPSLFRLRNQCVGELRFLPTGRGGNFHCGNVPRGLVGEAQPLDVHLKHYGYITRGQRQAKHNFYLTVDPNNYAEDNYRHLAEIRGARLAPGPPRLIPWQE
jgi:glycosyltransferase involved in cell wall biosynthesis